MSRNQKRVLWSGLIILSIAASAFVFANTRSGRGTTSSEVNTPKPLDTSGSVDPRAGDVKALNSTMPQGPQLPGPAQMVRFTVYQEGIRPSVVHTTRGLVGIYIADLTGSSAGLIIQNEARLTLGQIVRHAGSLRGSSRLLLVPGRYHIYDASRPISSATLIVEP